MTALICGSFAYDSIMVFPGRFKDHILPDRIHMLNVSFPVPTLKRNFGGTAGNIAYNLKLLGGAGHPMATVGHDFAAYRRWFTDQGVSLRYIREIDTEFTAQAFITTDLDDNQITAFHPGAMTHSHVQQVPTDAGITLGFISPDGREGMVQHATQFVAADIPFVFDPGQSLPLFNGEDLSRFIEQATWVAVNDYESQVLCERTGLTHEQLAARVKALIVTCGAAGSKVYTQGRCIEVPVAQPRAVKDPTGCGDAYRAGLIHGIDKGLDWETTGRVASLLGAFKIESDGPQNHVFSAQEFRDRFKLAFGYTL